MGFLAESFTSEESSKGGNHSYALNPGTRELDEKVMVESVLATALPSFLFGTRRKQA